MKLLRKIIIFLILRIDWRKLLLIGSVFTIVGVVVQISTLPYPLTIWVFSSSDLPLLYKSMNSNVHLNEKNSLMRLEQFETHLVDPGVSTNTSAVLNHAVSTNTSTVLNHVVSTNTSTVLNHVVSTNTPTFLNHVVSSNTSTVLNHVVSTNTPTFLNHAVSTNTSTVLNHVVSTNTPTVFNHVVSTNTSTNFLNQSMSIVEERPISSRKRGQSSKRRRRHRKAEDIVAPPPPLRPVPHRLLRYVRSLTPYEALVYAKKEMENISSVINDPDPELYAPLFRNVSVFQRSYELMELLLKVYIYQDGKRPIFHEPILQGIYSSEGWFMKLMEENRHFVTQDPEKAHLFYLPYSAKQLQTALYVPDSHNIRRLSFFLRDHVNLLAAKYPFWNRTRGSDHFLVACHDWGPYTLTEHEELTKNTIKALCNADASEGIFVAGKDVSLPETTVRNPKRPLRGLGGNRVSQRPILAFFAGHMHGRVRPTLLRYWNDKDEDMRIYRVLPNRVSRNMSYPMHMKSSKYCICPMGYEVNSPRIVESIYHECVPVVIADNFVPPLNEVLDWSSFSVIVEEKDIPKLKDILLSIPLNRYIKMQTNVKMLQQHFHWNARPIRYDMFHMILHSIWHARLNQIQIPQRS